MEGLGSLRNVLFMEIIIFLKKYSKAKSNKIEKSPYISIHNWFLLLKCCVIEQK